MREIKFRAWITLGDHDDDGNDKDYHGMATEISVHHDGSIGFTIGHAQDVLGSDVVHRAINNGNIDEIEYEWCNWGQSYELMQYTGLKDKNGVEIYEGDIIHFIDIDSDKPQFTLPVEWDDKSAGFVCRGYNISRGVDMASSYDTISGEVIGNIYENPDLLEK